MRLAAFLNLPGQKATDIARKCGVSVSTITRVAKGQKSPSMSLAERIRDATSGAVTADDYLPPYVPGAATQSSASSTAISAVE